MERFSVGLGPELLAVGLCFCYALLLSLFCLVAVQVISLSLLSKRCMKTQPPSSSNQEPPTGTTPTQVFSKNRPTYSWGPVTLAYSPSPVIQREIRSSIDGCIEAITKLQKRLNRECRKAEAQKRPTPPSSENLPEAIIPSTRRKKKIRRKSTRRRV